MATTAHPFFEEAAGDIQAREKALEDQPRTTSWKGKIWDTFDLPPAERRLLFKVDAVILTFASVGYATGRP
jgi:ACS family pantothenate transporter-like MFS transporter